MSNDLSNWVGRSQTVTDILEPSRVCALAAALGQNVMPVAGDPLPHLRHWLYFWDVKPPAELGVDGHPAKGGFLPPVPLPRRMWAGGRVKFQAPLFLGERVSKTSIILKVEEKSGKSGPLVFVTVSHEISGESGVAVVEEQDLVYREPAPKSAAPAAMPTTTATASPAAWRQDVNPDSVLLFRYSALTMNGHRIHYDLPYARGEEAYPGLVVHGPLQATLLVDLASAHGKSQITGFDFRGQSPAFGDIMLNLCGEPSDGGASVWSEQGGSKNMAATVRFA